MVRSLLLAASFPPRLGGIETLLSQTAGRLAERPLVLATAPASAPGLCVRQVRLTLAQRALYRPLWTLHPSLQYAQAFLAPAVQAIRAHEPRVLQAGHVDLAPLAWLLARRSGRPFVVYAYGQEVWRGGRRHGLASLDRRLRGRALAAADAVLVPGRFTAGLLADWQVYPARIHARRRPRPRAAACCRSADLCRAKASTWCCTR
jgi:Glycosyltransferase Family 4